MVRSDGERARVGVDVNTTGPCRNGKNAQDEELASSKTPTCVGWENRRQMIVHCFVCLEKVSGSLLHFRIALDRKFNIGSRMIQ